MSQTLKKIFSTFVTLTTIAWSVGIGTFALPGVASAATLSAGDLIKASTPAVYYYGGDGKRYVFPNEKTYKTWYADFSSVKTISDADLAAIQIGGNATYKPGVKMVKITTDPKVYAVGAGGSLRWVSSEAVAVSLYGATWNKMIDDVSDAFFVNYSIGSQISAAADFNVSAVSAAATSINVDKKLGGSVGAVGGSVSVGLASDSPAGMTVTKNASSVPLFKFSVTAGSADAVVTYVKIHRIGIGATTDIANVYLYDANGARLTTGRTVNSQSNLVEFGSLSVSVPAGTTQSLLVYGDFSTATTGGQHSFELMDAASMVVSGSGSVSGSFPVRGNTFTVGSASSGRLDIIKGTTPPSPNIGATDAEISNFKLTANTNDITVNRVTLLQAGSISNTDLSNLNLYQGNTLVATTPALTKDKIVLNFNPPFVIPNGQSKVFSLHARIAGRTGQTIKTYVEYTTDVNAKDNTYNTGASVDIATNGSFDGTGSNFITITTQGGQLTSSFNGPTTMNVSKGSTGVTLFKFSLAAKSNLEIRNLYFNVSSTSGNGGYVKGMSGTEYFTNFKIVNLDTGTTVMGPISMPAGVASPSTGTGKMTFADSFQMKAGATLNLALQANLSNTEDADKNFFTNGTSTYVARWDNWNGNLFGSTDIRLTDTGEYLTSNIVPNSPISGNSVTVKASSLSVALAGSPSSGTVVKKQANIPSVGLVFTAGGQSDVTVQSIKLTGRANTDGSYKVASLNTLITACSVFDGQTQVGLAQSPQSDGTMSVTSMNWLVPKGMSKTLSVQCTAGSTVTQAAGDGYAVGIATASTDVTAQDKDSNTVTATLSSGVTGNSGATPTVTQTVVNQGTLTIATDNLRSSTVLVAGGDMWQNLAQFKATAQNEDMVLDRIAVTSTGDGANFTAIAIAQNGAVKGQDVLPSGVYQAKDIDLSANPITVPKNGSIVFQVWAKLASTQASSTVSGATSGVARSGNAFAVGLLAGRTTGEWASNYNDQYDVRVTGAASGQRVYATTTSGLATKEAGTVGNTFVLRRSVPTVARQTLSTTTLAPGDLDMYKFQVSADPAGSISLKKVTFNLSAATSTGSSLTLSNFRIRRGASDLVCANDVTIQDAYGTNLCTSTMSQMVATSSIKVIVAFVNEDTISGSGNVYTLHATVGGTVVSGDSVNLSLTRTGDTNANTGYLTDTIYTAASGNPTTFVGPNLTTSSTATNAANALGTFVWSDQSESPHYSNSTTNNRSRDWTDDLYMQDLTQTQILSR